MDHLRLPRLLHIIVAILTLRRMVHHLLSLHPRPMVVRQTRLDMGFLENPHMPLLTGGLNSQTRHMPLMVEVILGSAVEVVMDSRRMEMDHLGRVCTVRTRPITDYYSSHSIHHPFYLSSSSSLPLLPFLLIAWTLFYLFFLMCLVGASVHQTVYK